MRRFYAVEQHTCGGDDVSAIMMLSGLKMITVHWRNSNHQLYDDDGDNYGNNNDNDNDGISDNNNHDVTYNESYDKTMMIIIRDD